MTTQFITLLLLTLSLCLPLKCLAQDVPSSPKTPWGEFEVIEEEDPHWVKSTLLWLPNRFADLFDIVRFDLGFGPAFGVMVRATPYFQIGVRHFLPASVRVGSFGRRSPTISETETEYGLGPLVHITDQRPLCEGEVGAGVDFLFLGAHVSICLDEVVDFAAGLVMFDPKDDDFQ